MKKPRGGFELAGIKFEWAWDDGSLSLQYPAGTSRELIDEAFTKIPKGVWLIHNKYWENWRMQNPDPVVGSSQGQAVT